MISGGMRRNAAFRRRVIERENGIARAARFKGTDLLEVFAFKK